MNPPDNSGGGDRIKSSMQNINHQASPSFLGENKAPAPPSAQQLPLRWKNIPTADNSFKFANNQQCTLLSDVHQLPKQMENFYSFDKNLTISPLRPTNPPPPGVLPLPSQIEHYDNFDTNVAMSPIHPTIPPPPAVLPLPSQIEQYETFEKNITRPFLRNYSLTQNHNNPLRPIVPPPGFHNVLPFGNQNRANTPPAFQKIQTDQRLLPPGYQNNLQPPPPQRQNMAESVQQLLSRCSQRRSLSPQKSSRSGLAQIEKPSGRSSFAQFEKPSSRSGLAQFEKPSSRPGLAQFEKPSSRSGLAQFEKPSSKPGLAQFEKPSSKPGLAQFEKPSTRSGHVPLEKLIGRMIECKDLESCPPIDDYCTNPDCCNSKHQDFRKYVLQFCLRFGDQKLLTQVKHLEEVRLQVGRTTSGDFPECRPLPGRSKNEFLLGSANPLESYISGQDEERRLGLAVGDKDFAKFRLALHKKLDTFPDLTQPQQERDQKMTGAAYKTTGDNISPSMGVKTSAGLQCLWPPSPSKTEKTLTGLWGDGSATVNSGEKNTRKNLKLKRCSDVESCFVANREGDSSIGGRSTVGMDPGMKRVTLKEKKKKKAAERKLEAKKETTMNAFGKTKEVKNKNKKSSKVKSEEEKAMQGNLDESYSSCSFHSTMETLCSVEEATLSEVTDAPEGNTRADISCHGPCSDKPSPGTPTPGPVFTSSLFSAFNVPQKKSISYSPPSGNILGNLTEEFKTRMTINEPDQVKKKRKNEGEAVKEDGEEKKKGKKRRERRRGRKEAPPGQDKCIILLEDNKKHGGKTKKTPKVPLQKEEINADIEDVKDPDQEADLDNSKDGQKKKNGKNRVKKPRSLVKFERFITLEEVTAGLIKQILIKGEIRINPKQTKQAYITDPDNGQDIIILGSKDRNRALEGDIVVLQLHDEADWLKQPNGSIRRSGKVVHILDKVHSRRAVGTLRMQKNGAIFTSRDGRFPLLFISLASLNTFELPTDPKDIEKILFKAMICSWNTPKLAIGVIENKLGLSGEIEAETAGIFQELGLEQSPVPEYLNKYLPSIPYEISEKDLEGRLDLRSEIIFTIDPAKARDLDDAVSIKKLSEDEYEVGVHIADVTHFLEEGTPLDLTVSDRATTVYMVERAYHMLPIALCTLCSLLPGEDKLCLSVIFRMDPQGNIQDTKFNKTIIRSCAQLSYDHAQAFIEGEDVKLPVLHNGATKDVIKEAILAMYSISKQMRERRFAGGALKIDNQKLYFELNSDGYPKSMAVYEMKHSNRLIEEFMLKANEAVARHIYQAEPKLALLRRHEPPKLDMLVRRVECLEKLGISLDCSTAGTLHNSLISYCQEDPFKAAVLNLLLTKPMNRAMYFCDSEDTHHYALNLELYTHFTSPIRRYADIVVHRVLTASLGLSTLPDWTIQIVNEFAQNCNRKKLLAKRAGDMSSELFRQLYIRQLGVLQVEAAVYYVHSNSVDVIVPSLALNTRVYCDRLEDAAIIGVDQSGNEVRRLVLEWKGIGVLQELTLFSKVMIEVTAPQKYTTPEVTLLPPVLASMGAS